VEHDDEGSNEDTPDNQPDNQPEQGPGQEQAPPPATPPAVPAPAPAPMRHLLPVPYLRAWRGWRGYTRPELRARTAAQGHAVSLDTMRAIEARGHPATPTTVKRLADALGISMDALLHTDPTKLPPP
jgi:hypothetical protein